MRRRFSLGLPRENGRSVLVGWGQLPLAIAPGYVTRKMALCAAGIEVLQESDAKRRLTAPAGPADDAREWHLKFQIVRHTEGVCPPADVSAI